MLPHKTLIGLSVFFALSLAAPLQVLDSSESTLHARGSPSSAYSPCSGKDCHPKPKPPTNLPIGKVCVKYRVLKSDPAGVAVLERLKANGDPHTYKNDDYVCYGEDMMDEAGK